MLTAIACVGAFGLSLQWYLWPVGAVVIASLPLLWLKPEKFKIVESLATLGLPRPHLGRRGGDPPARESVKFILRQTDPLDAFVRLGGGKAANLRRLGEHGFPVPAWFCVTTEAFAEFVRSNRFDDALRVQPGKDLAEHHQTLEQLFLSRPLGVTLEDEIGAALVEAGLDGQFVAVRSSGIDEDSAENSFAGQFSSYMFQHGLKAISKALRRCWASAFTARAISYRMERGPAARSHRGRRGDPAHGGRLRRGRRLSRDPIHPLDRDYLLVSSVWGLGEGLVSGELDADHFRCKREGFETTSQIAEKTTALAQGHEAGWCMSRCPRTSARSPR